MLLCYSVAHTVTSKTPSERGSMLTRAHHFSKLSEVQPHQMQDESSLKSLWLCVGVRCSVEKQLKKWYTFLVKHCKWEGVFPKCEYPPSDPLTLCVRELFSGQKCVSKPKQPRNIQLELNQTSLLFGSWDLDPCRIEKCRTWTWQGDPDCFETDFRTDCY